MPRTRNKKVQKLRNYRDKLLVKITNLEGVVRHNIEVLSWIKKCMANDDNLRAYALASDPAAPHKELKEFIDKNEIAKELALAYRMLNVERRYTAEVQAAAQRRDYLRVAALSADHQAESIAHDKMLGEWTQDHGFKHSMKKEMEDADII